MALKNISPSSYDCTGRHITVVINIVSSTSRLIHLYGNIIYLSMWTRKMGWRYGYDRSAPP